jgi:hypothetical protein
MLLCSALVASSGEGSIHPWTLRSPSSSVKAALPHCTLLSSPQLSCAAHLRIIILVSSALLFSPGACLCCHTSLEQKYKHDDDSHSRNSSIYHNRAKAKLTATAYRFLLGGAAEIADLMPSSHSGSLLDFCLECNRNNIYFEKYIFTSNLKILIHIIDIDSFFFAYIW